MACVMNGNDRTLITQRLVATPCQPQDREHFTRLERDHEVMRFLNGGAVDDETASNEDTPFLRPRGIERDVWTLRRRAGGGFVGWISLIPGDEDSAELGYRLCRSAWGQGFATEMSRVVVDWGFAHAGYARITAQTMAVNRGSRRVLEKIGMRLLRTEFVAYANPIAGSEQGEAFYEMSHDAWAAARAT